jgi:hypothetical protein
MRALKITHMAGLHPFSRSHSYLNDIGAAPQYGSNKRNGESGQAQFEQFLALPFEPKTGDDSPYLNRIEQRLRCGCVCKNLNLTNEKERGRCHHALFIH